MCNIAGILILPLTLSDYFFISFYVIYFFVYWFSLVYCITIGLFFHRKNFDRGLFGVKSFINQLGIKKNNFILIFRQIHHFLLLLDFYFLQCNAAVDEIRVITSWVKKKNKNWSILMSSQDITLLLCGLISSHRYLVSASFKHDNKFFNKRSKKSNYF